jgi:hypothetical protein
VAEFAGLVPVFLFLQNPAKFLLIYIGNYLPYSSLFFNSVLQSWGAKSFPRQKILRQNFRGRISTSSLDIQM